MARQVCEGNKSRDMVSSTGFCYSDVSSGNPTTMQTHLANQIQGFVSDPEMFNITAGMELIGFQKNLQQQQQQQQSHDNNNNNNAVIWKSFIARQGQGQHLPHGPSSSKTMNQSCSNFYQHEYNNNKPQDQFTSGISETSSENLIMGAHDSVSAQWQENRLIVDDSSLRCVFPCEGNERPSQGLSLSLNSNNPSNIGLQSFELRQTSHHHHHHEPQPDFVSSSSREGLFGKSANTHHNAQQPQQQLQQQQMLQQGGYFVLKNSKYLVPAQDLLNEFCSLDTKHCDDMLKQKSQKNMQWEEDNNGTSGGSGSSSKKHSLTSIEFAELQKRKTKLLSMLEEVDRRYRHYRNQMKAVVSSFEAVAGNGAATVYSALALKAMSRHFRSLKDGILSQIHATRKTMGEKDPVAPGTTRGETPKLKIIDQTLRQQRAFQQMSMMETHPWRPQRGLPERSVSVLRAWLFEHFLHPYPSDVDKHILARQTGLSRSQVSNWFINARVRLWKPMVEEMYLEETKENENNIASSEWSTDPDHVQNPTEDQKPTPDRLVRFDSECASSIINNHNQESNKNDPKNNTKTLHHMNPQDQCLGRSVTDTSFGSVELDFSSYTQHSPPGMVSYASNDQNMNQGFKGGNSGVSLTLGLQQHGGTGVSLAFPPPTQSSLLYSRDQIEDCQSVQYSLLDGEGQNLPYRNLMGAQLLHDFAG